MTETYDFEDGKGPVPAHRHNNPDGSVVWNKIRPKGDTIGSVPNSASDSVSVLEMINEVGNHVKAGKNRRNV